MSGAMLDDPTPTRSPFRRRSPSGSSRTPTSRRAPVDPGLVIMTCANCGAAMDERKCKLICRCGYFLSCSDYY